MKNKKIIIAIFLILLIAAVVALELVLYNKNYNDVPENYIAVFVGFFFFLFIISDAGHLN